MESSGKYWIPVFNILEETCNWECGIACPDPITLYRLFTIFDVEPNEFFGVMGVGALLIKDERCFVDNYRELDRRSKNKLNPFAESLASRAYKHRLQLCAKKQSHMEIKAVQ